MDGWDRDYGPKWTDGAKFFMMLKHGQAPEVPSMSAEEIGQQELNARAEAAAGKAMFLESAVGQAQQQAREAQDQAVQAQSMAQEAEAGRQQAEEALSAAQQESRDKDLLIQEVGQAFEEYKQAVTNIGRQMPGFDDLQDQLDASKAQKQQAQQIGTELMQEDQMAQQADQEQQAAQQQAQVAQAMQPPPTQQPAAPMPGAMPPMGAGEPKPQGM